MKNNTIKPIKSKAIGLTELIVKTLLVVLVIVLIVWNLTLPHNNSNKTAAPLIGYTDNSGIYIPRYSICYPGLYQIEWVDELNTQKINNCYAFKNKIYSKYERADILKSMNTSKEYYESLYKDCEEVRTLGTLYCLKNKTKCLQLEGNICNLIDI
jgi:hypothetical protein